MRRGRWIGAALLAAVMVVVLAGCQTATVLQDGRVLVVMGDKAFVYDPATNAITPAGAPGEPRVAHSATLLADGRVLLAGGAAESRSLATTELFDPVSGTFAPGGALVEGRSMQSATLLQDGRVLLAGGGPVNAGGEDALPPLATAELFDPTSGTSRAAAGPMAAPRAMHSATLLGDGTVLIAGGTGADTVTATAERFDPETGAFAATGDLATGRALHTATLLGDGSVIVIGGMQQGATEDADPVMLASIERYDPATSAFSPAGSLAAARGGHTATLLADGRILVAGGLDPAGAGVITAELVDPAAGTSTPTGDMSKGRGLHSASLLPSGDVLMVGGELDQAAVDGADPLGTPEVYRVATGTFETLDG